MVSVPRDLIDVPLGNGDDFGPKLNSLVAYADRHPKDFPDGGVQALEDAIGALLGIEIHYYARIEFFGFVDMVDAVGRRRHRRHPGASTTRTYDGFGFDQMGLAITAGASSRRARLRSPTPARARAGGESDFTRAIRQQQVLVALRDAVTQGRFAAVGAAGAAGRGRQTRCGRTCPVERLPRAGGAHRRDRRRRGHRERSSAIRWCDPRRPATDPRSSPDLAAIREVAERLFPEPGMEPTPWPTPEPTTEP